MGQDKAGAVSCRVKLDPMAQTNHRKNSIESRAAELHMVWTELCIRERKARIRNQQLLQNFSGLEAQLACLAAKTDALRRRKRDHDDFLQHLQRDLQRHQESKMPPGWVSDKPLELQAGSPFTSWSESQPLLPSKELPFAPFERAPADVADGRHCPGLGEDGKGNSPWLHPCYPMNFISWRGSEYSDQALLCQCSLQRAMVAWLSPEQSGINSPWRLPGKMAMPNRGPPQGWFKPCVTQAFKGHTVDTSTASYAFKGEKSRGATWTPATEEEQPDTLAKSKGSHQICGPDGTVLHPTPSHPIGMFGGGESALQGPPGLSLLCSEDEGAGSTISSSAEVGHWAAERAWESVLKQTGKKAKHRDANLKTSNEGCTPMSSDRYPGLPEHEEVLILQGPGETWGQGKALPKEGERGGEGVGKVQRSGDDQGQGRVERPGLESEHVVEECGPGEREGSAEGKLREGLGGLQLGQEGEVSAGQGRASAGDSNGLDLEKQEEGSVMEQGEANPRVGALEGGLVEVGRSPDEGRLEGQVRSVELEPGGAQGEQHEGNKSDDEQEGPISLEEDEGSTSSDSVKVPSPGLLKQNNVGSNQTHSPQSQRSQEASLMQAGTESVCGEEEEEESEADADVEAALAPWASKPAERDRQRKADVQSLQELWVGSEEPSKEDDDEEDDFYD